jgi:hypothetical protein
MRSSIQGRVFCSYADLSRHSSFIGGEPYAAGGAQYRGMDLLPTKAAPAIAKEGLYIGGPLFYTSIGSDTQDAFDKAYFNSLDSGPGIGLRLGWGLNNYFAIEGSLSRSYHKPNFLGLANTEDQVLEGQSLVFKINVPLPDSKLEPYVFVVGRYNIGDSNGPVLSGIID